MTRTQSEETMTSGWKSVKLGEIAQINPTETLKKGTTAKKVAMEKLRPYCRDIPEYELSEYNGGAKFRNGDTIMARITPCLENGKIAKVGILDEGEVGFGSTEFIVFRANEGFDEDFVYYLVCSSDVKAPAIKSMVGSSGRQRVQTDVVQNLQLRVPPLDVQRRIAAVLKPLDDKIELNGRINARLEEAARALFKSRFVRFEPYGGTMPAGWRVGTLSEIVDTMIAGDWGKDAPTEKNTERVYCIRGADIPEVKAGNKGKMPMRYIQHKNLEAKQLVDGDIVVEISGGSPTQSTGRVAAISQSLLNRYNGAMVCTNFCKAIKTQKGYSAFVYYYWQYLYDKGIFFTYENGTTGIKNLDISGFIEREPIVIPTYEDALKFADFCKTIFDMIFANGLQSETLARLRDVLLPRLMSGAVDVRQVRLNTMQEGGSR